MMTFDWIWWNKTDVEIWDQDIKRYQDDEIQWNMKSDEILQKNITRYHDDEIWELDISKFQDKINKYTGTQVN